MKANYYYYYYYYYYWPIIIDWLVLKDDNDLIDIIINDPMNTMAIIEETNCEDQWRREEMSQWQWEILLLLMTRLLNMKQWRNDISNGWQWQWPMTVCGNGVNDRPYYYW